MSKSKRSVLFVLVFVLVLAPCCHREKGGSESGSPTSPTSSVATLTVSPTQATFKVQVKQCFNASGGTGVYEWRLDNGTGTVPAGNKAEACYIASFPVRFTMTVYSGDQKAVAHGEVVR